MVRLGQKFPTLGELMQNVLDLKYLLSRLKWDLRESLIYDNLR